MGVIWSVNIKKLYVGSWVMTLRFGSLGIPRTTISVFLWDVGVGSEADGQLLEQTSHLRISQ